MFALESVKPAFHSLPGMYLALQSLLQICGLLWSKVVPQAALPRLKALLVQAVCLIECFLPVSEMDIKLHELSQMADSIENLGAPAIDVHAVWSMRV